jgi:hypothetical protein
MNLLVKLLIISYDTNPPKNAESGENSPIRLDYANYTRHCIKFLFC